ncbi:MAG: PSD1 and planctomycete cytochrome C domain-containing protein, partial [Bacteroidales bacterium]|nr:PSD1 and planctomycete cytochrome C domain-containing protein [Bacteroidales bacterium]
MLRSLLAWVALILPIITVRAADAPLDFNRDVRPILSNTCFACHGPDENARKADLRLDTRTDAIASGVLVPGKPDASELLRRVLTNEADELMPPAKTGKKLTAAEKETLRRWIAQGAPYAVHWAYARPVRPTLPPFPKPKPTLRNPIDSFIEQRLNREGWTLQPEADRETLARRVALDLTGLPPSLAAVDRFLADRSTDAYERYVDHLLAQPAFGEHWARLWLDLARYADSAGYADDPARTIWAFRDYVIRSFNQNKPFDQFTIEQIAGDLLPQPTEEQLVATAFHRNTLTNSEGGTNDEEFRNAAIVDRVNTTLVVWMGTSMACAQCHTHKYDPITQAEYFQLFAFFNNTADADKRDESPLLLVGDTPEKQAKRAQIEKAATTLERASRLQSALIQASQKARAEQIRKELAHYQHETTVPILRELTGKARRTTKMQLRGNFLDTGDVVTEGVPAAFPPLPPGAPRNRLTLARWLVSPENPLTARVTVNRFWQQIFGTGLVRT